MNWNINKSAVNQIIRGIQWTSGIFAIIISILLLATVVQVNLHDPINTPALSALMHKVEREPSNTALKEEIRALDLLARKAYFTSWEQLRFGALLLFAATAVFLLCWKIRAALSPSIPSKPGDNAGAWWARQSLSRRGVMAAGALFVATALFGTATIQSQLTPSTQNAQKIQDELNRYWVNFRGPYGNGVATHQNAPVSWNDSTGAGIRWKTEVPLEGMSSPIVYKRRIFLTGGTKKRRDVYCFDVRNGRLKWRREVKVVTDTTYQLPKVDRETGYAAPTPACDGKRVYAIFATSELVCYNLRGKKIWARHLGATENHYGHSSSLITYNGMLFIQYDQYDVGRLLAVDGKTGETIWEAKRKHLSWSSPICVNTGKRYELILTDNETVTSYNPATGQKLWSHACLYGEVGPSAAYASGMVFAANEYAIAAGIDLNNPGPGGVPPIKWEWRGSLPNTSSPAAKDSLLFLATSSGTVTCLHAATGKEIWYKDFDDGFYSSPVIAGKNVYLTDREGITHIFEASDEYRETATCSLGEKVDTTPAILDGFIILRGEKHLFRIDGAG